MKDLRIELDRAIAAIKIEIDGDEKERLLVELNAFLQWLELMEKVDTDGVDPVLFGHNVVNELREDLAVPAETAKLQEAASNFEGGYYLVPPIIE